MSDLFLLSEAQMRRIEPYFPLSHGIARVDDRMAISGIVFVIKNGLRWRDAPREYGPHKTIYNRLETTSFLHYFSDLRDYREPGKVEHPLPKVLLLILLAVLAGAETFTDIARFGEKKLELLRRFRPFKNGTPAHDNLGDIFATLDPKACHRCFVAWVAARTNTPVDLISLDGKTSRRSGQTKATKEAIHMVSAFAARQRIVLGQVKARSTSVPPDVAASEGYKIRMRKRMRIEEVFGCGKTVGGLAQLKVRGLDKMKAVSLFSLAAYNIVRLPKLLQPRGEMCQGGAKYLKMKGKNAFMAQFRPHGG